MMKTYWETGVYEKKAIFEAYFRKLPFENGYAIFAGLERIVRYIEQLRFSKRILTIYVDLDIIQKNSNILRNSNSKEAFVQQ